MNGSLRTFARPSMEGSESAVGAAPAFPAILGLVWACAGGPAVGTSPACLEAASLF
eukprot:CAMPEP_0206604540 /NCGR_PEP_ID=MMETSP0325_2-20121206/49477_1 /ASSEMBLY_ACC=CAM_ASM_000347 /TAXON_ID=2866 /ORGANISM="Crypthecodinium cohnii, Strain Seligo" /LENGTH=55 /DNA_ID=CAMNT_0054119105 /DNA_START=1184 /DNA_END=1351 /DNA_ORIENTATION=+